MSKPNIDRFWCYFEDLSDSRKDNHLKHHSLEAIVLITILGVLCGADSWVEVEEFGYAKQDWLKELLDLPYGIPSHDTIGRVFSWVDSEQLQSCFLKWIQHIAQTSDGDIVAIDGKTLRRSYQNKNTHSAIHMVSAWSSANELVLGQLKTAEKSNEITAIPELLNKLCITGCTVTIDAMGCQRAISETILEKKADYVLALKGNQSNLHEDVVLYLDDQIKKEFKDITSDYYEDIDKGHGRIEIRRCWVTNNIDWLQKRHNWPGLQTIAVIEAERQIDNETTVERRYYISSRQNLDAQSMNWTVRKHWGIENKLHWSLDMSFNEDQCRVRTKNAAENFGIIRHIAINMLKKEKSKKVGLTVKRRKAGWNNRYLTKILAASGI